MRWWMLHSQPSLPSTRPVAQVMGWDLFYCFQEETQKGSCSKSMCMYTGPFFLISCSTVALETLREVSASLPALFRAGVQMPSAQEFDAGCSWHNWWGHNWMHTQMAHQTDWREAFRLGSTLQMMRFAWSWVDADHEVLSNIHHMKQWFAHWDEFAKTCITNKSLG